MPKPPPFKRPGISLSTGEKKEWRPLFPSSVRAGDLVQGLGLVHRVTETDGYFHIIHGEDPRQTSTFPANWVFQAFVEVSRA